MQKISLAREQLERAASTSSGRSATVRVGHEHPLRRQTADV